MEGTLRSVDPLAYYVNTLSDFDAEVVTAYKKKDNKKIKQLAATGKMDMDVFICVNKRWHGFILCVPAGEDDAALVDFSDVVKSPFDIPAQMMCWQYELCIRERRTKVVQDTQRVQSLQGCRE